jgi:hypothetical protein
LVLGLGIGVEVLGYGILGGIFAFGNEILELKKIRILNKIINFYIEILELSLNNGRL